MWFSEKWGSVGVELCGRMLDLGVGGLKTEEFGNVADNWKISDLLLLITTVRCCFQILLGHLNHGVRQRRKSMGGQGDTSPQYLIILYDYAGYIHLTASTSFFPAPKISNPGRYISQSIRLALHYTLTNLFLLKSMSCFPYTFVLLCSVELGARNQTDI